MKQEGENRPTCDRECQRSLDGYWINRQCKQRNSKRFKEGCCHSAYFGRVEHNEREQAGKNQEGQQLAQTTNHEQGLIVKETIHQEIRSDVQERSCVAPGFHVYWFAAKYTTAQSRARINNRSPPTVGGKSYKFKVVGQECPTHTSSHRR